MWRMRFCLCCILVAGGTHWHTGSGARIDPRRSSNQSENYSNNVQSPDAGGYFGGRDSDYVGEYSRNAEWRSLVRDKRGDDSTATNSRKSEQNNAGAAICRKKRKDSVGWTCEKIASCQFSQYLLSSKQQTICGREGSSQKICCPYRIDPVKAAQEKCKEYSEFRYRNRTVGGLLLESEAVVRRELECENKVETLIVGGEVAAEREFPHMALVGNKENDQNYIEWMCGGSLISSQYVLSAAHCNDPTNSLVVPTWVLLGLRAKPPYDAQISNDNLYRIVKRTNHPGYRPPKQENDITLFKLERPAVLGTSIRPLCLALPPNSKSDTNAVIATGWGRTAAGDQESDVLLKVTLDRLEDDKCVNTYKDETTKLKNGFDAKIMMCAGRLNETKDTCQGDSGGPIQAKIKSAEYQCMWFQEGITSLGSPYCGDQTPAVYTKVSTFLSWIQPIVWPAQDLEFA